MKVRVWKKPEYCPICGSENIQRTIVYDANIEEQLGEVWFQVECKDCEWRGEVRGKPIVV